MKDEELKHERFRGKEGTVYVNLANKLLPFFHSQRISLTGTKTKPSLPFSQTQIAQKRKLEEGGRKWHQENLRLYYFHMTQTVDLTAKRRWGKLSTGSGCLAGVSGVCLLLVPVDLYKGN